MSNFTKLILMILRKGNIGGILFDSILEMNRYLSEVDWPQIVKVAIFIGLAGSLTILLLVVNDKVFAHYNSKRIKRHRLTIQNNGNVPSIFLFRTIDLPKQLAVRFRIGDMPMIWVSRKETAMPIKEEKNIEPSEKKDSGSKDSSETSLVPDLKDPFQNISDTADKTVKDVRKTANNVGRTAGLLAGVIGSVMNLFGIKSNPLQNVQQELKDVQQQSNQAIQTVNSKIGTAETLVNQAESVVPKNSFGAGQKSQAAGSVSGANSAEPAGTDSLNLSQPTANRDFIFDEEVWRNNIGKIDEKGGDLNYSMSKTLEPGESMQIDVDIMMMANSSAPISLMYKIEVLQIPQTNLQLAAPKEYINGIVIYPKISLESRILPYAVTIGLIVISLQLLAGYSHLIY